MAKRKAQDWKVYIWIMGIAIGAIGGFGAGVIVTTLLFQQGILVV